VNGVYLLADLQVPELADKLVIFAYEFGRSRNHPRTRHVARIMREHGLATLLCDLQTEEEEVEDEVTEKYRHDADFLAHRLVGVTNWALSNPETKDLKMNYFGASTGSAAVLIAAAKMHKKISALVSRGGRLDLAVKSVPHVQCPTLLIVGEKDTQGVELCQGALARLSGKKDLVVVPGASRLFGEPGSMESMAHICADWIHSLDEH